LQTHLSLRKYRFSLKGIKSNKNKIPTDERSGQEHACAEGGLEILPMNPSKNKRTKEKYIMFFFK